MTKVPNGISLSLGSGGARGLTQIGIIRWLENNSEYKIRSIAGASMGALIGGIYAAGKLDTYEDWVTRLHKRDVLRLLDFTLSGRGLFSGERIMRTLKDMLGETDIEDLPISFTAVATDLNEGREVWLSKGPLFDAIRASIAIPTIFTPVEREGYLLVDGGLLNPVPIAPTLRDRTSKIIAVSLSGRPDEQIQPHDSKTNNALDTKDAYQNIIGKFIDEIQDKLGLANEEMEIGIFDIISRSIEAMQNSVARFRIAAYNPDHLIEIPVNVCGMFEFYRAQEMIDLGYQYAEKVLGRKEW